MSKDVYRLMNKNLQIGTILYSRVGGRFYYKPNYPEIHDVSPWSAYPLGLFGIKASYDNEQLSFQPNIDLKPQDREIREWLSNRVAPSDRENIGMILERLGLAYYDMWELNKLTKSMTLDDYLWISNNLNDKFEELHYRYLAETGQEDKISKLKQSGVLPVL